MCLPIKPFKVEREWESFGLKCAVVLQQEHGHRCGYVRVPPTHKLYGIDYNDLHFDVHGGLTFGDKEPCEHEDGVGWWFGFDCAHFGDAMFEPDSDLAIKFNHGLITPQFHYWTQSEVESETERLAAMLSRASK